MKGQILNYDNTTATGLISGDDGTRYPFSGSAWRGSPGQLRNGARVDFSADGGSAQEIYAQPGQNALADALSGEEKSPIVAGLLALFLGPLGIHKFYLGYSKEGVILLVATVVSWVLTIVLIGLFGIMAIGAICLIEAVLYLTKSPGEFNRIYVEGHRPWF